MYNPFHYVFEYVVLMTIVMPLYNIYLRFLKRFIADGLYNIIYDLCGLYRLSLSSIPTDPAWMIDYFIYFSM